MLVISRRKGQSVTIGDEIELVVTEVHRSSVKLGIRAPRELTVLRGEVRDSIEEESGSAAEGRGEPPRAALPAPASGDAGASAGPAALLGRAGARAAKGI